MTSDEALRRLGLGADATPQAVTEAWRKMRAALHPDRGGDATEFALVREAYAVALAAQSVCRACAGTGRVLVSRGLNSLQLACERCGGAGRTS